MTLNELDIYFNSFLNHKDFTTDVSLNGIQIQNSAPDTKQITKIAFAVDACQASVQAAAEKGAQMLFVHHGLFWGGCETITGSHYKRVAPFIQHDIALFASHIPLDANHEVGNNYGLAYRLNLQNCEPFGLWRGMTLGVKGVLPTTLTIQELASKVLGAKESALHILPFGKKDISTVGIISGGAGDDVDQAIAQNLDAYITGEIGHELYHFIQENQINAIAGGHYQTETVGVNLVRQKVEKELGLETVFIDLPTGL